MVPRYPSEQEVALETGLPRWNRALRSLLGILFLALFVWGLAGDGLLDNPVGLALLGFLGASLIIQSLLGTPGCEITAGVNLLFRLLRRRQQVVCP